MTTDTPPASKTVSLGYWVDRSIHGARVMLTVRTVSDGATTDHPITTWTDYRYARETADRLNRVREEMRL